ncbi:MAG TPA: HAMP domain-containing sensor histidine kinase [Candidatus Acidoferrales bacterium]|nr:HAMP domain-containing sensor histidine kinase [Candidatus Acidoferrales bacterium]
MLERRLFASYLGAFAVVIIIFAAAVRFSFESIVQQQATNRLATLARAGEAATDFVPGGFVVNEHSLGGFDVDPKIEGLEWFDPQKRLVTRRGHGPPGYFPPQLGRYALPGTGGKRLETYTIFLRNIQHQDIGYVRAALTSDAFDQGVGALDLGIMFGSVLAILAASVGGSMLARASLARTEASYERLREFTADASHELRSPLTALSTTAAVALHEAPDMTEKTKNRLISIASTAKEMNRLVDDLLILARAGRSLEREMFTVHVDAIVNQVCERYRETAAAKSIKLAVEPGAAGQVIGNPEQVSRIIANLVENAIRYTPDQGTVLVSCTGDPANVHVSVEDNGLGIAPEHLDRIFDRFWRGSATRTNDGGSGLGLAIARALAERHGGRIIVSSQVHAGSTFTITLPRRPPALG